MRTIRWGIIGCGDVTEVKSGPAFQKAEGSALVAVMRRDGEKARDYARRHGVARAYDCAELVVHDPQVDAVYVATPPSTHAEMGPSLVAPPTQRRAGMALAVGAARNPCLVEKPMARGSPSQVRLREAF